MVQISSFLHSTFKDLYNEYSHAQIQVKTKKLWPDKLAKKNKLLSRNCCDQKTVVTKNLVATTKTTSRPACCVATKNAGEN